MRGEQRGMKKKVKKVTTSNRKKVNYWSSQNDYYSTPTALPRRVLLTAKYTLQED
jgi:hypothetical protein